MTQSQGTHVRGSKVRGEAKKEKETKESNPKLTCPMTTMLMWTFSFPIVGCRESSYLENDKDGFFSRTKKKTARGCGKKTRGKKIIKTVKKISKKSQEV
jgi:hypothetical protein